jgi:hypothetical protein
VTKRLTDSPVVESFRATAEKYCGLVDRRSDIELAEFLGRVQPLLASLVAGAMALPDIVRGGPVEFEEFGHDQWQALFGSLGDYFGQYDVYWELFDPYLREEPISSTLANSLSSVYRSLFPGVRGWERCTAGGRRTIVWDWQFNFDIVWGHDAIDALRAIHALLFAHHVGEAGATWPPEPQRDRVI